MFGPCRICLEKDHRISDLQSQIEMLKKVAFPQTSQDISIRDREMDRLLNGDQDAIELTQDEILNEASAILTGSYETSQVEVE